MDASRPGVRTPGSHYHVKRHAGRNQKRPRIVSKHPAAAFLRLAGSYHMPIAGPSRTDPAAEAPGPVFMFRPLS
jgi:hypothetical protein